MIYCYIFVFGMTFNPLNGVVAGKNPWETMETMVVNPKKPSTKPEHFPKNTKHTTQHLNDYIIWV